MGVGFRGNGSLLGPRSASRLPRAAQIDTVLLDSERRLLGLMLIYLLFERRALRL